MKKFVFLLLNITVLLYLGVTGVLYAAETKQKNIYPSNSQKMWALATCAVLTESNIDRHDILGGRERTEENIKAWKTSLQEWWGVENRKDLLDTLKWIEKGGHRKGFAEMGAYLASPNSVQSYIYNLKDKVKNDPERKNKVDMVEKHYRTLGRKSLLGWDYSRYVSLCGWGYLIGYLSEAEAWEFIMPVAIMLQETFDSWEDLGRNYLIGREFWSLRQTQRSGARYKTAYDKLCAYPDSPWLNIPWNLDLKKKYE
ncbi:DUF1266 domain-containing protein [bacterium]|nr:DUF1266 domain-containing protein [bacterium]